MTIAAVILDVDGTLVDSNDAHTRAWVDAFAAEGITVARDAVRRAIGMGSDKLLPALTGIDAESPRGREIIEHRSQLFRRRYLPHLQPFPATRALFHELRAQGVRVTVASSSPKEDLEQLLDTARVADLIEVPTSSDVAGRSKPDPDVIRAALAQLGDLRGARVSMVGDTPYDIAAARSAGVRPLAVRCGGWSDGELGGAAVIFDDPADMLARLALVTAGD